MAQINDAVNMLLWRHTKKGTEKPPSVLDMLIGKRKPGAERKNKVFRSGKDFMREYRRFTGEA